MLKFVSYVSMQMKISEHWIAAISWVLRQHWSCNYGIAIGNSGQRTKPTFLINIPDIRYNPLFAVIRPVPVFHLRTFSCGVDVKIQVLDARKLSPFKECFPCLMLYHYAMKFSEPLCNSTFVSQLPQSYWPFHYSQWPHKLFWFFLVV